LGINLEIILGLGRGWFYCDFAGVFEGGGGKRGVFLMVNRGEFVVDCW
jgi:hypothetical protein